MTNCLQISFPSRLFHCHHNFMLSINVQGTCCKWLPLHINLCIILATASSTIIDNELIYLSHKGNNNNNSGLWIWNKERFWNHDFEIVNTGYSIRTRHAPLCSCGRRSFILIWIHCKCRYDGKYPKTVASQHRHCRPRKFYITYKHSSQYLIANSNGILKWTAINRIRNPI